MQREIVKMTRISTALLASVGGDRAAAIPGFESAWFGATACGRALTVRGAAGDNLALHQAVLEAEPRDVIVLDVGGARARETGHCGDILALAAQKRGIGGFVVNGAIRDRFAIAQLAFPVFHRGTSPGKPLKEVSGEFRVPLDLIGVLIEPGDLIAADDDGIVVVQAVHADDVLRQAAELELREQEVCARVARGETTVDIFRLASPR